MQTAENANSGPGYAERPDHKVETAPAGARVRVVLNGAAIAESDNAVLLTETNYPPRYYIPLEDVVEGAIRPADKTSYCPFKGTASYWAAASGEDWVEDAAWGYHQPYDEVLSIANHVCFDDAKVDAVDVG